MRQICCELPLGQRGYLKHLVCMAFKHVQSLAQVSRVVEGYLKSGKQDQKRTVFEHVQLDISYLE